MAAINKIEDLLVWQKSRELIKLVFSITANTTFDKEYFLKDQLKRSAISIMSNIAEGYGRGGNKEFIHFLYISNGSINELKSQLYIAHDLNFLPVESFKEAVSLLTEIELMIKSLAKKLKEADNTGIKFKAYS